MGEHRESLDKLTEAIIGAAIEVHRELGAGLLESVYEECLSKELEIAGLHFLRQPVLPVHYKGTTIEGAFRMDLLVDNAVVVEVKSVEKLLPIHEAQLLTYLRLSKKRIGLLLNFNVKLMKNGIRRIVL
ncbi:MAG: GxxExxY protein [Betaproteobacteria bacterium]|nr:GxxExxY protein [Betaproteobacteria bacterium]